MRKESQAVSGQPARPLVRLVIACRVPALGFGLASWLRPQFADTIQVCPSLGGLLASCDQEAATVTLFVAEMAGASSLRAASQADSTGLRLAAPMAPSTASEAHLLRAGADGVLALESNRVDFIQAIETLARGRTYSRRAAVELAAQWSAGLGGLTARQQDVLAYLATGRTVAEISGALYLSENTIRTHIRRMCGALGIRGQEGLRQYAQTALDAPEQGASARLSEPTVPQE